MKLMKQALAFDYNLHAGRTMDDRLEAVKGNVGGLITAAINLDV